MISITIIQAHKEEGHSGHFFCPILDLTGHLVAVLLVDNTVIIHIDLQDNESAEEVYMSLQDSIHN